MKRLISLTALIICSFTISFGATQTWRLTNDSYSDSLPQIARDNSGNIWVTWLSNANGNYDVCLKTYQSASWSSPGWLNADTNNQNCVRINYDSYNDRIWAVWDSVQQLRGCTYNSGTWTQQGDLLDTNHLLFLTDNNGAYPFRLASNDSGKIYLAWSSGFTDSISICFRCCTDTTWDTTEIAMQTLFFQYWIGDAHYINGLVANPLGKAIIADSNAYYSSLISSEGVHLTFSYWVADSGWTLFYDNIYAGWSWSVMSGYSGNQAKAISLCTTESGEALFIYADKVGTDSACLTNKRYSGSTFAFDSTLVIKTGVAASSGSSTSGVRPTLAWSDGQKIFLNAYYDTMWSHQPVQISDSNLVDCINPDIVAENDSTVWVCYQSDGEIYVNKTSVPLGITGDRPEPNKIAIKPYIHAYPNPASNRVNISYSNNGPAVVSIYDITGGRIRSLTANNGQAVWDCRNQQGNRVSSGVYFIRAKQDNNEIIKKINIVR